NTGFASGQKWQLMVRRFEERARQHRKKFRWRIDWQIKCRPRQGSFTLFAAILPVGATIFDLEMFLNRCLHVVVATPVEFDRDSGSIDSPGGCDVVASSTIVVGVLDSDQTTGVCLHSLRPGRISLDQNLVRSLFRKGWNNCNCCEEEDDRSS